MKFRYYITDLDKGLIVGTDEPETARDFAASEDYFVVDTSNGTRLTVDGGDEDIAEV